MVKFFQFITSLNKSINKMGQPTNEINQLLALSGCKTLHRLVQSVKENLQPAVFMMECFRNNLLCQPSFETVTFPNKSQIVMFSTQLTDSQQPTFTDVEQFLSKLSMLNSTDCYSRGLCFKFDTSQERALIHDYVSKLLESFKINNILTFIPPNDGTLFYVIEIINPSQNLSQTSISPCMEEVLVAMLQNYKPTPMNNSSWSAYKGYVINKDCCFVKKASDITVVNGKIYFRDYSKEIPAFALADAISGVSNELPESESKKSTSWFLKGTKLLTNSFCVDIEHLEYFYRNTSNNQLVFVQNTTRTIEVAQSSEIPLCIIHQIIDYIVNRQKKF